MTHSLRTPSSAADRAGFSIMKQDCRLLLPRAGDQIRLASRLIASAILFAALGGVDASAAPILASATRTAAFLSTSTTPVSIPLRESGAKSLKFDTTVANQKVVIIYNAECVVAAPRGSWLSISILVDGIEAEPSSGTDFALCSAVDAGGQTWSSVVRQSALKVPAIGSHTVTILAHLLAGSGSWRLDDSSLVVQPALALATREDDFLSSAFSQIQLPLKQDGTKELNFSTNSPNEHLKITYNAECVVAGSHPAQGLRAIISVGLDFSDANADLCHAIDSTGKTWAGAAQQMTLTVPTAGIHTTQVFGNLTSGVGAWRVDDSSLVVTRGFLASAVQDNTFNSSSTTEVEVPIAPFGGTALQFTTTKTNQLVKLTYNGWCAVRGERGRALGLRMEVDGVQAAPASGFDFALCSSLAASEYYYFPGFRQSVIIVPTTGVHNLRVFARVSSSADWALGSRSVIIE